MSPWAYGLKTITRDRLTRRADDSDFDLVGIKTLSHKPRTPQNLKPRANTLSSIQGAASSILRGVSGSGRPPLGGRMVRVAGPAETAATAATLGVSRVGLGVSPPSRFDVFSDGSPSVGPNAPESAVERAPVPKRGKHLRRIELDGAVLLRIHSKLQAASYTHGGQDWKQLFADVDKDNSESIEPAELLSCVRRGLKIPPTEVSDSEVHDLFEMLDEDNSGDLEMAEVRWRVSLVGRAGRRVWGVRGCVR